MLCKAVILLVLTENLLGLPVVNLGGSSSKDFQQEFRRLETAVRKNGACITQIAETRGKVSSIKFEKVKPRIVLTEFVFWFEGNQIYLQDEPVDLSEIRDRIRKSLGENAVIFDGSKVTPGSKDSVIGVIRLLIDAEIDVIELILPETS